MSYNNSVSKIENIRELIGQYKSFLSDIDFSKGWDGAAYASQNAIFRGLNTYLDNLDGALNSFISALQAIDLYDEDVTALNIAQQDLYKYKKGTPEYISQQNTIRSCQDAVSSNKNAAVSALDAVNFNYSSQLTVINGADLVNTYDSFNELKGGLASLEGSFDISKHAFFDEKIPEDMYYPKFDPQIWYYDSRYRDANIGQCTWFTEGRFYELYGLRPDEGRNGRDWADLVLLKFGDKFEKGYVPKPGAVFSLGAEGDRSLNHTGVILDYDPETQMVTFQDGNYNGTSDSFSVAINDWGTRTKPLSWFTGPGRNGIFANPKPGVLRAGLNREL